MAAACCFKSPLTVVPSDYAPHYDAVLSETLASEKCGNCGAVYTGAEVGMLGCRFHPFQYLNNSARVMPYDSVSGPPSECLLCNEEHLDQYSILAMKGGVPGRHVSRLGCTRIDHCGRVMDVINKPYTCVPLAMADMFFATRTNFGPENARSVCYITRPGQMNLTAEIQLPGTAASFLVPIVNLYTEVSEIFALEDLQKSVRMARRGPNASSITRIKEMHHTDNLDLYRLYADEKEASAEFIPFAVVARVEQSQPITLSYRPEFLQILDDDALI